MDSPEKIDKFISAEFPGNRHPNEEDSDRIGTLVEDLMVHAPCYREFFSLTLMHGKNINVCEHVNIIRKSKCFFRHQEGILPAETEGRSEGPRLPSMCEGLPEGIRGFHFDPRRWKGHV